MMRHCLRIGIFIFCWGLQAQEAICEEAAPAKEVVYTQADITDFINALGNKALDSLGDKSITQKERENRFRKLLDEYFDIDGIANFTLGIYKRRSPAPKRAEYALIFREVIARMYAEKFSQTDAEFKVDRTFAYPNKKFFKVQSSVIRREGPKLSFVWLVHVRTGKPLIKELMVEGIGMSQTLRDDYAAILQKSGIDGLIKRLRASLQDSTQ